MEIKPHHVASANTLVICRPFVKADAFAQGAAHLVAIARAGIGYDKIDLAACTANDVVVFNTPHGMTHSTASAAMFFILALSKRFPLQQRIVREHRWDLQKDAIGDDLAGLTNGEASAAGRVERAHASTGARTAGPSISRSLSASEGWRGIVPPGSWFSFNAISRNDSSTEVYGQLAAQLEPGSSGRHDPVGRTIRREVTRQPPATESRPRTSGQAEAANSPRR